MKSIVIVLTIGGVAQNAILKTNDDGKSQNFTIMQVEKPAGLSAGGFPVPLWRCMQHQGRS